MKLPKEHSIRSRCTMVVTWVSGPLGGGGLAALTYKAMFCTQAKDVRDQEGDNGRDHMRSKMVGCAQARSCNERCCIMSLIHQSSAGRIQ